MSEEKQDNAISIIRMDKLLAGIVSKIQSIEKHGVPNSPLLQEITDLIELFKECVISEMKKTPEEERMLVISLLDYQKKIGETSSEIEALQGICEEQNSNAEIFLRDTVTCINNEEKIMGDIRETSKAEILREIEESMRNMLIVKQREEARGRQLQSKIDAAKHRLRQVVERNATNEKRLRDMCAQIEREYKDFLAKYDCDIGASYKLWKKLSKDNEAIKAETQNMEDQLVVQRELFVRLKNEREIALMKAFNEKLELFRRTRAAKIIQRTWRTYFERISLKKRKKSKKK